MFYVLSLVCFTSCYLQIVTSFSALLTNCNIFLVLAYILIVLKIVGYKL